MTQAQAQRAVEPYDHERDGRLAYTIHTPAKDRPCIIGVHGQKPGHGSTWLEALAEFLLKNHTHGNTKQKIDGHAKS